jgi:hypothetical protein
MEEVEFEQMCKKFEKEFFEELDTDTLEVFAKTDLEELITKIIDNAKLDSKNKRFEIWDNYNCVIQFFVAKKYNIYQFFYLKQIISAIDKVLMYM